jgi:hypothetical protein
MCAYHLDLSELSLDWLRRKIADHEIVPARRILQREMPERFRALREAGIETVADVVAALKDPGRVSAFAHKTGLPEEYLFWLVREARSYRPNPFALRDIPGLESTVISALERVGIKTTKSLFDRAAGRKERDRLSAETGIPASALRSAVGLADLARIRGLGKTFVRLFAESSVGSIAAMAKADPEELRGHLRLVNERRQLSSVVPSLKDVAEYVEMARDLPDDLEP